MTCTRSTPTPGGSASLTIVSDDPLFVDWARTEVTLAGIAESRIQVLKPSSDVLTPKGAAQGSILVWDVDPARPLPNTSSCTHTIACHDGDADNAITLLCTLPNLRHVQGRLLNNHLGLATTLQRIFAADAGRAPLAYGGTMLSQARDLAADQAPQALLDEIQRFAAKTSKLPEFKGDVRSAAEELVANARIAHSSSAEVAIQIDFGADTEALAIAATDPQGSMNYEAVIRGLERCVRKGADQVVSPPSTAGIGLYMVCNMAARVDVIVRPQRYTTVVVTFRIGASPRVIAATPRSLHFYLGVTP